MDQVAGLALGLDSSAYKKGGRDVASTNQEIVGSSTRAARATDNVGNALTRAAVQAQRLVREQAKTHAATTQAAIAQQNLATATSRAAAAAAQAAAVQARSANEVQRLANAQTMAAGATDNMARVTNTLRNALGGLGFALLAREVITMTDAWTNAASKLRLVTEGSEQLALVQANLFTLAQDSRQSYEATSNLYARLARSSKQLGVSQQELLTVTETVNKAFVISGATAAEAAAAIVQLGQGLASDTLRGDELRSVLEQAPRLAEAIATGMGVTIGQLRILGSEGQLTSKAVVDALLAQSEAVRTEFGKIPPTIGQAMTVARNEILRFVGASATASGAAQGAAQAIIGLARNVNTLLAALTALAATWLALKIASWASAIGTATKAFLAMAAAARAAGVAFAVNPLIAALIAVTGPAYAVTKSFLDMRAAIDEANLAGARLKAGFATLDERALVRRRDLAFNEATATRNRLTQAQESISTARGSKELAERTKLVRSLSEEYEQQLDILKTLDAQIAKLGQAKPGGKKPPVIDPEEAKKLQRELGKLKDSASDFLFQVSDPTAYQQAQRQVAQMIAEFEALAKAIQLPLEAVQEFQQKLTAGLFQLGTVDAIKKAVRDLQLPEIALGPSKLDRQREALRTRFVLEPQGQTPDQRRRSAEDQARKEAEQAQREAAEREAQRVGEETAARQEETIRLAVTVGDSFAYLGNQMGFVSDKMAMFISDVVRLGAAIVSGNPEDIIGQAVNVVADLFGGNEGRERRNRERAARQAQIDSIDSFLESIRPRGSEIEELTRSYQKLHEEGRRLGLANHELARLTEGYRAALERLEKEQEKLNREAQEDIQVRALLAQGRTGEASALQLRLDQERELAEAIEEGYNDATIAALKYLHILEAEAAARALAEEQQRATFGVNARGLRARGDVLGAQREDVFATAFDAAQEAERLRNAGIITTEQYLALIETINREVQNSIAAIEQRQTDITGDLTARRLAAEGQTRAAEDYRFQLEQEREIRDAVASGITDYNLALLKQVQAIEAATRAQKLATEAQRASEDLQVRLLRAEGRTGEADELRFKLEQEREIADAIEAGRSEEFLAQLRRVQMLETANRAQAATVAGVSPNTANQSLVAQAQTVTATQAESGIAIMRSMLFYLQQIAFAVRGPRATPIVAGVNADRSIAEENVDAATTLGLRPAV